MHFLVARHEHTPDPEDIYTKYITYSFTPEDTDQPTLYVKVRYDAETGREITTAIHMDLVQCGFKLLEGATAPEYTADEIKKFEEFEAVAYSSILNWAQKRNHKKYFEGPGMTDITLDVTSPSSTSAHSFGAGSGPR